MSFDILVLLIAIILFSVLAFRRISAIILGPLVALFVIICMRMPILGTLKGEFMASAVDYIQRYFFVFFVGALFGAIYEKTRAAESVARAIVRISGGRYAAAIVMTITGLLTYGGISGFVIFFAMYPIALQLFRKTDYSRKLIPAAISAGTWTWSMSGPGSPSIQNVIPMDYLGTSASAAFAPSAIVALLQFVLIFIWLEYRSNLLKKKGYTFHDERLTPLPADTILEDNEDDLHKLPHPLIACIPAALILILFNLPGDYGWDVEAAVMAGVVLAVILFWRHVPSLDEWISVFNKGAGNSVTAILNTAIVVGFAGVVSVTSGFDRLIGNLKNMRITPLAFVAVTVAIAAGAAGSASGGMGIAFQNLSDLYIELGVSPEHIHRISAIAAGTLDTLPHQGAQITLLTLCSLTHKEAYFDIAITQIAIPIIAVIAFMGLAAMGM